MPRQILARLAIPVIAALMVTVSGATPLQARVLNVGPGQEFSDLGAAEPQTRPGDVVRLTAGEHFDCAVFRQSGITIEGTGGPADTVLTDRACAGKAALVIDGVGVTVRNLTLTRMRVPDGNGAGIRAEGRDLTVDHVRFINNQNGILAAENVDSTIIVRDSEFLQDGFCGAACAHAIYAGNIKLLRVERSKFFETKQGHHVKSRAARTEVVDCDMADGASGRASYSVESPNGGSVVVTGSHFQKGPMSDNHTAVIIIGNEGVTRRTPEIRVENNTFHRDGGYPTYLVRNLTATPAELVGNKLSGDDNGRQVMPLEGDGNVR